MAYWEGGQGDLAPASVHKNIIDILSISFLKILGAKNNPVRSSNDQ